MTSRIYYTEPYRAEFDATVTHESNQRPDVAAARLCGLINLHRGLAPPATSCRRFAAGDEPFSVDAGDGVSSAGRKAQRKKTLSLSNGIKALC